MDESGFVDASGSVVPMESGLADFFYRYAAVDMPGVSFEQFVEMSDLHLEASNYLSEIAGRQTSRTEMPRFLPDYLTMYRRYILGYTSARKLERRRRLRNPAKNAARLVAVSYVAAGDSRHEHVATLGVPVDVDVLDDLGHRLQAFDIELSPASTPAADRPFGSLHVRAEDQSASFELGEPWLRLVYDELMPDGTIPLLPENNASYALLDLLPSARPLRPSAVATNQQAIDIAYAALSKYYGATIACMWLSTVPGFDIWTKSGYNSELKERVLAFADAFSQRIVSMAEEAPTVESVVASFLEQVRRIQDPLGRIGLLNELGKEMPDAITQQMIDDAAAFRAEGGKWREIGDQLGITAAGAQMRLDPASRERNAERLRGRDRARRAGTS